MSKGRKVRLRGTTYASPMDAVQCLIAAGAGCPDRDTLHAMATVEAWLRARGIVPDPLATAEELMQQIEQEEQQMSVGMPSIAVMLQDSGLAVLDAGGQVLFPMYANTGAPTTQVMAFVANDTSAFDRTGLCPTEAGLSSDGRCYAFKFTCTQRYTALEVLAMIDVARAALAAADAGSRAGEE